MESSAFPPMLGSDFASCKHVDASLLVNNVINLKQRPAITVWVKTQT